MLRSSHPNERENKIREEDLELGFERRLVVGPPPLLDGTFKTPRVWDIPRNSAVRRCKEDNNAPCTPTSLPWPPFSPEADAQGARADGQGESSPRSKSGTDDERDMPLDALLALLQIVGSISFIEAAETLYVISGSTLAYTGMVLIASLSAIGILHSVGAAVAFAKKDYTSNLGMLGLDWMVSTFGLVLFIIALHGQGVTDSIPWGAAMASSVQTVVLWMVLYRLGTRKALLYFALTVFSAGTISGVAVYVSIVNDIRVCELRALVLESSQSAVIWNYDCEPSEIAPLETETYDGYEDAIYGTLVDEFPFKSEDDRTLQILGYTSLVFIVLTGAALVEVVLRPHVAVMGWCKWRRESVIATAALGWILTYPVFLVCRICPELLDWGESLVFTQIAVRENGRIVRAEFLSANSSNGSSKENTPNAGDHVYRWRGAWDASRLSRWLQRVNRFLGFHRRVPKLGDTSGRPKLHVTLQE